MRISNILVENRAFVWPKWPSSLPRLPHFSNNGSPTPSNYPFKTGTFTEEELSLKIELIPYSSFADIKPC